LPSVTFTALPDLCIDAGVQSGLGGGLPTGGVYSGPGVTDAGNGTNYSFDPATAGVGPHTLTYTYTDGNGCTASAADDIEVLVGSPMTYTAPADIDICIDISEQTGLGGGTPIGGVYSGPGVTDDGDGMTYSFDPLGAGIGTHTLTYTYINPSGCTNSITDDIEVIGNIKTWNGTTWSPAGAPDATNYVIIDGNYQAGVLNHGNLDVCALVINAGATLSIPATGFIRVNNDITVDGSLVVEHEGSVVQVDDAAVTVNNGTINVAKDTPYMNNQSFLFSGSPMTLETREGVFASSYIVRDHNTMNFVPNPDVQAMFPLAINFADDNGDNWINHTGLLNPGEGYMHFPQPDTSGFGIFTHNFTLGTLNNGLVTQSLVFNGSQYASPNFVSNPYASAINADLFFDDAANAAIDFLYFWDHITPASATYPGYNAYNFNMGDISRYSRLLGGTPASNGISAPSKILSSGQGFAIRAASAGITATFNNAMRITGPNDTYRTTEPIERNRLWVRVHNETYDQGSVALIGFTDVSTDGYNKREDDSRIATPVSIYSEVGTGEELGINAMGPFEISDAITVGFSTMIKELVDYKISIHDMDGADFENVNVYLIDADNGSVTNLSQGDYTFQSGEATYSGRFKIVFEYAALGSNNVDLEVITLYPNPTQDKVTIISPRTQLTSATIFDIRGRKVSEVDFRNQTNYQIDLSSMEIAVYFIEIATDNGTVMKRVMKN
jgi:hypothetical protein